jgi:hypothetical protein
MEDRSVLWFVGAILLLWTLFVVFGSFSVAHATGETLDNYVRHGDGVDDITEFDYDAIGSTHWSIHFCNLDLSVCHDDGGDLSGTSGHIEHENSWTGYFGGTTPDGGEVIERVVIRYYSDFFSTQTAEFEPDVALPFTFEEVEEPILGCTDFNAANYDPEATQDDGSCIARPTLTLSTDPVQNVLLAAILMLLSATYVRRVFFS